MIFLNRGGDRMVNEKKKNLSKAKNHNLLQVGQLVKDGFNEALKDFTKQVFCSCFKIIFILIVYFLINLFK